MERFASRTGRIGGLPDMRLGARDVAAKDDHESAGDVAHRGALLGATRAGGAVRVADLIPGCGAVQNTSVRIGGRSGGCHDRRAAARTDALPVDMAKRQSPDVQQEKDGELQPRLF